jgi:hypothetical protein
MSEPRDTLTQRIRRLRRDHPEIAARLDEGEFASVSEAEAAARGEQPDPAPPPRLRQGMPHRRGLF